MSLFSFGPRVVSQEGEMGITNEGIGDRSAIEAAVRRFHERVSADPELAGYFHGMDMRRILARQLTLLAFVAAA